MNVALQAAAQPASPRRLGAEERRILDSVIVVIDDSSASRKLICAILKQNGFLNVHAAVDGAQGVELVRTVNPGLVILDLIMPVMDGFEACAAIRQTMNPRLPILVESGLDDDLGIARAFAAGASDVMRKPIHVNELIARVRLHLERKFILEDLAAYRRRMEDELRAATAMQSEILPRAAEAEAVAKARGAALGAFHAASSALGGDLWSMRAIDARRFAVCLLDFVGHGVGAALNTFRAHTVMSDLHADWGDPVEVLSALNKSLCGLLPVGQYATAIYAVFDIGRGQIEYAAAGSPEPILIDSNGGHRLVSSDGVPLGCDIRAAYDLRRIDVAAGDGVLFYSDALVEDVRLESYRPSVEDVARIAHAVRRSAGARRVPNALAEQCFTERDQRWTDDLTIVFVEAAPE